MIRQVLEAIEGEFDRVGVRAALSELVEPATFVAFVLRVLGDLPDDTRLEVLAVATDYCEAVADGLDQFDEIMRTECGGP